MKQARTILVLGQTVRRDALLAALHNNTRPMGLGALQDRGRDMTREEAAPHLGNIFSYDWFAGRPLKVHERNGSLGEDDQHLYDRDAGPGAFARALAQAIEMSKEQGT